METWAHGQDVVDALGATREATARLRHVAHIGVGARAFSYLANGLDLPADPVRVELTAPDGSVWTWGPADAANRVSGPALDFCLLVTQRRHRDDTALVADGPLADHQWLAIAQAFAGPPGGGRVAGQFAGRQR
ncbi:TIGR03084 family protein [Mycobacteroides abscessus subsp. abscessus]|nr:TIGR03084 family protein [Mycobacteroides abscessus subsp. abscessus]